MHFRTRNSLNGKGERPFIHGICIGSFRWSIRQNATIISFDRRTRKMRSLQATLSEEEHSILTYRRSAQNYPALLSCSTLPTHTPPTQHQEINTTWVQEGLDIQMKPAINSSVDTHKRNGSLNYEGVPYQCTFVSDERCRYRCSRYLPGGASDSRWCRLQTAKVRTPIGMGAPSRCPGVLVVNQATNVKTITIAHECTLASSKKSSGDVTHYQGVPYTRSSTNFGISRYRCRRYSGISLTAKDVKWYNHIGSAKARHPDGRPHRCPGTMIVNQETNERTVIVAHECLLVTTAESDVAGSTGAAFTSSQTSKFHGVAHELIVSSEEPSERGQLLESAAHDHEVASRKVSTSQGLHQEPSQISAPTTSSENSMIINGTNPNSCFPNVLGRHRDGIGEQVAVGSHTREQTPFNTTTESDIVDERHRSSSFSGLCNLQVPVPEKSPSDDDESMSAHDETTWGCHSFQNDSLADDLIGNELHVQEMLLDNASIDSITSDTGESDVERTTDLDESLDGDNGDPGPYSIPFLQDLIDRLTDAVEKRNDTIKHLRSENMALKKEFAHGANDDHEHLQREIDYLDQINLLQEQVDSNNDKMDEQENDMKVLQHELGISTRTLAETVANLKSAKEDLTTTRDELKAAQNANDEKSNFIVYLGASLRAARESIMILEEELMKSVVIAEEDTHTTFTTE